MAVVVGGCVTPVDLPDMIPDADVRQEWSEPRPQRGVGLTSIAGLADDARLVSLIERALVANPDLAQTAFRLRESGALLGEAESRRWPTDELTGGQSRADTGPGAASTSSLRLDIAWEVDIWGRLADQVGEANQRHRALEADYRAARNSLAARTLQTALQRVALAHELAVERRRVASLEATLDVIRERFRLGLTVVTDWDAAKTELATAEADFETLADRARRTDRDLSVLLGDLSLLPRDLPTDLPIVELPAVSLPAEVLATRPDVAAARARLLAAGTAVAVSRKALLPSFTVSAHVTHSGPRLDKALEADPLWSLLGNLAAPLINRKALTSEYEASQYREREAAFAYRAALLTAVLEVENTLSTERALARGLPARELAWRHAELARESFEDRYARGLVDILDLLSAQRTAFDTELGWFDARSDLLRNRIELGLAVGLEAL
ncbi:MAG: TolC family protein [Acidobacteriota bacterium]